MWVCVCVFIIVFKHFTYCYYHGKKKRRLLPYSYKSQMIVSIELQRFYTPGISTCGPRSENKTASIQNDQCCSHKSFLSLIWEPRRCLVSCFGMPITWSLLSWSHSSFVCHSSSTRLPLTDATINTTAAALASLSLNKTRVQTEERRGTLKNSCQGNTCSHSAGKTDRYCAALSLSPVNRWLDGWVALPTCGACKRNHPLLESEVYCLP